MIFPAPLPRLLWWRHLKFLRSKSLVVLAPDKAKGHCIVPVHQAEAALEEHIRKNYKPVKLHQDEAIKYLDYREGRVGRVLTELRDASLSKFTISDKEFTNANTSQSNAQSHVLTVKIHKLAITEAEHGYGEPIKLGNYQPGHLPLKFRFISPFSNSPSTKLGRFLGDLLKPLQNSGLRTVSIQRVVQSVKNSLRSEPLGENETLVSFDAISMYDHLTIKLAMHCIRKRHKELEEATGRHISLKALEKCLEVCYEEGVLYAGRFYRQSGGAPTGHPISSVIQNVILSTYELEIFEQYKQCGKLKLYHRWVDDILCRLPSDLHATVLTQLNEFDPDGKLQFTCELATQEDSKFRLPFLDFETEWTTDKVGKQISFKTSVYRKATACRSMKPFQDFGPSAWRTANLVWFLRRAVSHSSSQLIMHEEFEFLRQQFRLAGYPDALISKKIQQTVEVMLGYSTTEPKTDDDDVSDRWIVLHLPWCGEPADRQLSKLRRLLPRSVCRITIAYTTTKFRNLLPSFRPKQPENADKKAHIFIQSNLVYRYNCACGKSYIGETKRRLATRAKEHGQDSSPMSNHLAKCGQAFDKSRFEVIARNLKGSNARKKYETLMIKDLYRRGLAMNICETSRCLKVFS